MTEHLTHEDFWKLALAWAGATLGGITLSGVVLSLTGLYTALQIYILFRDKIWRHRPPQDGNT